MLLLTLKLLLCLGLHVHGVLHGLDTCLPLLEPIEHPLLLHELGIVLTKRVPSPGNRGSGSLRRQLAIGIVVVTGESGIKT